MDYNITLQKIEHINHNVLRLVADKPKDFSFKPGQATNMAIDKDGFQNKKRPFTFTSLPEDNYLEFTIKVYRSHDGVTKKLETLNIGDQLIIGEPWGAIAYKGKGTFIAGGAGVTPFIAIFKDLMHKDELKGNKLFFSNKKEKDIIYKNNLDAWLGNHLYLLLSDENHDAYAHGHINKSYLNENNLDVTRPVYLCGPPEMMEAVKADLYALGLSKSQLVTED